MDPVVAGTAERHEIAALVCAALADRDDVMHFLRQCGTPFRKTLLAERMLRSVAVPDLLPGTAVFLVYVRCT